MINGAFHSVINVLLLSAFHAPQWAMAAVVMITMDIYMTGDSR